MLHFCDFVVFLENFLSAIWLPDLVAENAFKLHALVACVNIDSEHRQLGTPPEKT